LRIYYQNYYNEKPHTTKKQDMEEIYITNWFDMIADREKLYWYQYESPADLREIITQSSFKNTLTTFLNDTLFALDRFYRKIKYIEETTRICYYFSTSNFWRNEISLNNGTRQQKLFVRNCDHSQEKYEIEIIWYGAFEQKFIFEVEIYTFQRKYKKEIMTLL